MIYLFMVSRPDQSLPIDSQAAIFPENLNWRKYNMTITIMYKSITIHIITTAPPKILI